MQGILLLFNNSYQVKLKLKLWHKILSTRVELLKQHAFNLSKAQQRMAPVTKKCRMEVVFEVGDSVFLKLCSHHQTTFKHVISPKLTARYLGHCIADWLCHCYKIHIEFVLVCAQLYHPFLLYLNRTIYLALPLLQNRIYIWFWQCAGSKCKKGDYANHKLYHLNTPWSLALLFRCLSRSS